MPEGLEHTVPAATAPLPAGDPPDSYLVQVKRWLEGYHEDNKHYPGLIAMVTELYEEAKLKRERREAIGRALASGGVLAIIGLVGAWLKEHLK